MGPAAAKEELFPGFPDPGRRLRRLAHDSQLAGPKKNWVDFTRRMADSAMYISQLLRVLA